MRQDLVMQPWLVWRCQAAQAFQPENTHMHTTHAFTWAHMLVTVSEHGRVEAEYTTHAFIHTHYSGIHTYT